MGESGKRRARAILSENGNYGTVLTEKAAKRAPKQRNHAAELLGSSIKELRAQLVVLKKHRAHLVKHDLGFDKDLAQAAASLGRAITGAAAEQRQQEKHVKDIVGRMSAEETQELIRDWIAEQGPQVWQELQTWLGELIRREMILS